MGVLEPKDLPSRLFVSSDAQQLSASDTVGAKLFNLDLKSLYWNSLIILILPVTESVGHLANTRHRLNMLKGRDSS
jgi:hypothetical protein